MVYTKLNDLHHIEWFILLWKICTTLKDLYRTERFVLFWTIQSALDDLYNVESFGLQRIIEYWLFNECQTYLTTSWTNLTLPTLLHNLIMLNNCTLLYTFVVYEFSNHQVINQKKNLSRPMNGKVISTTVGTYLQEWALGINFPANV